LARLSDGNFHLALKLTHGGDEDLLELTKKWLNALYQNKGLDLMAWIDEVTEGSKELQKNFLLYILQLFEHAVRFKQIGISNMALLETEQKIIENILGKGLNAFNIDEIADLLNAALYQIERNANTKILFHALSLRIQKIFFTQKTPKVA
jgi:DNA polymerase-3 subunit delta'